MREHFTKKRIGKTIGFIIGGLILAAFAAFIFGLIVMLLWNWLMPNIFSLPEITYIQAWGLVLLSHILFKSTGHGGRGKRGRGKFHGGGFKHEMRGRFMHGRPGRCEDFDNEEISNQDNDPQKED